MRKISLSLVLIALAVFVSLPVFGIEKAVLAPAASGTVQSADVRFRMTADPATLDWNLARSSHETYIIMNIMEGLIEEGSDLHPHAALAERWDVSEDGKTYIFILRPEIKWSDGRPLKASDFVDSWLRLLSPKTDSSYASFLFDIENAQAYHLGKITQAAQVGIKALDDSHLRVTLLRSTPYFPHLLSFWVTFPVRSDLIKKYGASWASPGKIVTLGPYLLAEWRRGELIRLKRNPSYVGVPGGSKPQAAIVDAIIEPNDQKARSLFENGQIDILLDATTGDLLKSKMSTKTGEISKTRAEQFPYLATYYLGFNVKAGPLKNVNVRRAIALSIDREAIPSLLQGGQIAAKGWLPPGLEGYDSDVQLKGTLYDARGALVRAGFSEGENFPHLTLWVEKFDGAEVIAEYVVKALHEKLGIELESRVASPAEFQRALKAHKAELFIGHWGADFPDPSNFLEVFASGSGTNSTGWSNKEFDTLLEKGRSATTKNDRMTHYASAERLLLQTDIVIEPLFYRRNTVLLGSRIQSLEISPLNYLFLKAVRLKP